MSKEIISLFKKDARKKKIISLLKKIPFNIIFMICFFTFLFFTQTYNYNDPDSYYYLAMSEKIVTTDNTFLGNVLYNNGLFAGKMLLFITSILCFLLFYNLLRINGVSKIISQPISLFFYLTPFLYYLNSWYARIDKNIFQVCIFLILLNLFSYRPQELKRRLTLYGITLLVSSWFCSIFWQGWKYFLLLTISYIIAYEGYRYLYKIKAGKITIGLIFAYFTIMFIYSINAIHESFYYVMETNLSIYHLLMPEVACFILILLYGFILDKYSLKLKIMGILVLISGVIMPRLMLLMIPMLYLYFGVLLHYELRDINIMIFFMNWKNTIIRVGLVVVLIILIFIPTYGYKEYFNKPVYGDIFMMSDPCENITGQCTIISDWSDGHVYKYVFNERVMFKGHPDNLAYLLDLMYYKNQTCDGCVLIYKKIDPLRFEMYAKKNNWEIIPNWSIEK